MANAAEVLVRCAPHQPARYARSSQLRALFRYALCAAIGVGMSSRAPVVRAQQGSAVLVGSVSDAATSEPVADAVVVVTSSSQQDERIAVTDQTGAYRIPDLAPGAYVLRIQHEHHRPYARTGLDLHADTTVRSNASLLPETLRAAEVVVVSRTPTVDIGSTITGMNITSEFTSRIPISSPGVKGSAVRSFESVADVVPGAQPDAFGVSILGATSPENRYLLDGLSVSNPVYGLLGTPLSIDFIKEISVLSGGYMPEYGRSTGGIINAITKSGSNEFHGSVFMNVAPGSLAGSPKEVRRQGQTVLTQPKLSIMEDVGGDVAGPIVRDRLWFYAGFDLARTSYDLQRSLYRTVLDADGNPIVDAAGDARTERIPGTSTTYNARQDMLQGIGKLTWKVNPKNRLTFTLNGVYAASGGNGRYGINPITGQPEIGTESTGYASPLNGPYSALAHRYPSNSTNVLGKWSSELSDKLTLDTWLGWHLENSARLPSDGSAIGGRSGLAALSNVWWLRNNPPHSITDFESVPKGACDAPASQPDAMVCPVTDYHTGGPEYLEEQTTNRFQGRSMFTYLIQALGHHVFKAGVDVEHVQYDHKKAYSGGRDFVESDDGSMFLDGRVYGYLTGPDEAVVLDRLQNSTRSLSLGSFIQDSWSIMDRVTLNLGVRYDAQLLYAANGSLAMALANQWSPRAGVIYDPTREGRAKLFANYARNFETVPLDMLDRALSGEPLLFSARDATMCNPLDRDQQTGACLDPNVLLPIGAAPNRYNIVNGAGAIPVDPNLKPPSSDELVLGGEYEIIPSGRIGLSYTKRWLNRTIEDMSRDEGQTFFFGNPGYGIAADFPKAQRNFDSLALYVTKLFSRGWLGQASYNLSWLRGNYGGLFRAEDLQLDPHQSSDFDLRSLLANRQGPLPGDRRHVIKIFAAKDFQLAQAGTITAGVGFRANSGEPSNYLGGHALYGVDQVYILPRGSAERLPWSGSADLSLRYGFKFDNGMGITASVEVFNVLNFQTETVRDQRYTSTAVAPITRGGINALTNADGTPFDPNSKNPNFGRAVGYQAPRMVRFGLRGTF